MARYIDGFVPPVPKANLDAYLKMARDASAVWKEYGALEYIEAVADDVPEGEKTSFAKSVQLKPDETIIFAYIVYKSREDRDRVNAAVMEDPRIKSYDMKNSPFDATRMFWGGFKTILDA